MKSTHKLKNKFILNCGVEDYLKTSSRARTFSLSQRNSACRAPRGNLRAKSQNFAPNRTQHKFFKSNRKILCEFGPKAA